MTDNGWKERHTEFDESLVPKFYSFSTLSCYTLTLILSLYISIPYTHIHAIATVGFVTCL